MNPEENIEKEGRKKMINKFIYDKVTNDYRNESVELSNLFFDFDVKDVPGKDILDTYAELQKDINGDYIVHIQDADIDEDDDNNLIGGILLNEEDSSWGDFWGDAFDEAYTGNVMKFLETYPAEDYEIYRVMDLEVDENNNVISGNVLDFIF